MAMKVHEAAQANRGGFWSKLGGKVASGVKTGIGLAQSAKGIWDAGQQVYRIAKLAAPFVLPLL